MSLSYKLDKGHCLFCPTIKIKLVVVVMPAPSSMLGRHANSLNSANGNGRVDSTSQPPPRNSNGLSEVGASASAVASTTSFYDEVFASKLVSESKTLLWEIKDFESVFGQQVEKAMNFEFEVGRLGSMERHLPRRSRWKVMFDGQSDMPGFPPALRVLLLSPENKTIFYRLEACIVNGSSTEKECGDERLKLTSIHFQEGRNDCDTFDNLHSFALGRADFVSNVRRYIYEGSLFVKIVMKVLEDSSTH
ncbi:hypothetical protein Ocin01_02055 [Orchesella cincta]|uniref:Uncharacterized protein n=1 Tax=Orchesella cincta TaxID=48709 RepID=A0A1D2NHD4_ORCCI|nr:hypothetical protein Ocin01_02055 [Orchesella cincta]